MKIIVITALCDACKVRSVTSRGNFLEKRKKQNALKNSFGY